MTPPPLREIAVRPLQVRDHRSLFTRNLRPQPLGFQASR